MRFKVHILWHCILNLYARGFLVSRNASQGTGPFLRPGRKRDVQDWFDSCNEYNEKDAAKTQTQSNNFAAQSIFLASLNGYFETPCPFPRVLSVIQYSVVSLPNDMRPWEYLNKKHKQLPEHWSKDGSLDLGALSTSTVWKEQIYCPNSFEIPVGV